MKICLIFLWVILESNALNAQTGMAKITRVFSEEGQLQMLISYNPSCSCRIYTEYYPDGKVFAKRTFKVVEKGEFIDGEDVTYFHDGSIKQYKLWENAVPKGRAYVNFENGQLQQEEFYTGKYKTGIWRYFDQKGKLVKEQVFEDGRNLWNSKKDNVTVRYYKDGKLLYSDVLREGKTVSPDKKNVTIVPGAPPKHNPQLLDGKKLFETKCAVCHAFDKDGYGPSLKDVTQRRTNGWLQKMITNGMKLVEEGDKDAVALYHKYQKKQHLNMEYLTEKQVQAIISYLKKPD